MQEEPSDADKARSVGHKGRTLLLHLWMQSRLEVHEAELMDLISAKEFEQYGLLKPAVP